MVKTFDALRAALRKDGFLLLTSVCIVLILGVATLIQEFDGDGVQPDEIMISQMISRLADWENKVVKVMGAVEDISLGIIHPFNYWLSCRQNQTIRIGLRWHSDTSLSGRNVTVVGVVKKGYAWVNPSYSGWWTYYIDATSIRDKQTAIVHARVPYISHLFVRIAFIIVGTVFVVVGLKCPIKAKQLNRSCSF